MTILLSLILAFSVGFTSERRVIRGDPILVASAAAEPAECTASFDSLNNTSDHDTDLLIVTGGNTFVLADVETGAHVTRTTPVTLGDTVEIWLRPNTSNGRGKYVTSLGGKVTFECDEPSTTTSTTSTTAPESTTTTSTTAPAPSSTTTTTPLTTTSTTVSLTVSTTIPVTSTTWDPPPTTWTVPPSTLPNTGTDSKTAAAAGLLALIAGAGLLLTAKENE